MVQPHVIIIAGPNGAGKTTLARSLLSFANGSIPFINADEIQRTVSGCSHPVSAGKEMIRRIESCVAGKSSFALETTLSAMTYVSAIKRWRSDDYFVTLHFIELDSADYAIDRVARRVAAGGHAIPEADIRRRFDRGRKNFTTFYKPVVDQWYHWRSDDTGTRLV